ncbi:acetoacetate--CoA ligase [Candidatus Neomarinimicrobiota bacterium]
MKKKIYPNIMWEPSHSGIINSEMYKFIKYVNSTNALGISTYNELYNWSINNIPKFWASIWDYNEIISSVPYDQVVDDIQRMPGAKWFQLAKFNFAENLLRFNDDHTAIIFRDESGQQKYITYADLNKEVAGLTEGLRSLGVRPGDRVAGFMPNVPESIFAMLATTAIGATWSSSSPDFGIRGVLDRFSQIKPKIIFSADGYQYNGKYHNSLTKLSHILDSLPDVEKVIIVPYLNDDPDISSIKHSILLNDLINISNHSPIDFEQLNFNHPIYIMYSSGTSGLPKSIVHGAGGILLQHLKELRLHTDLKRDDTIFYYTTCGWMMWNWLVSSLAIGATLVLYEGSPFYPTKDTLWNIIDELGITVFGTSAKYIAASEAAGIRPVKKQNLSTLRTILSTGSPLTEENFDYVYKDVNSAVQLSSISGGTDIVSCFALGNPMLPVRRGELQCRGLGMKVESFSDSGQPLIDKKGELVCTAAFPSMPVKFWNDPDGSKYHRAYFNRFSDIWYHGDYISISGSGGIKIFGRSDATLNPGGVRIGTAEIYRIADSFNEILDSLVIGQNWENDERIILFVKLAGNQKLSTKLIELIKNRIKTNCSPRHVPAKILAVPQIPYTINGKKVEIAVKQIINGDDVTNRDALTNPEALDYFKTIPELYQ